MEAVEGLIVEHAGRFTIVHGATSPPDGALFVRQSVQITSAADIRLTRLTAFWQKKGRMFHFDLCL